MLDQGVAPDGQQAAMGMLGLMPIAVLVGGIPALAIVSFVAWPTLIICRDLFGVTGRTALFPAAAISTLASVILFLLLIPNEAITLRLLVPTLGSLAGTAAFWPFLIQR